MAGPKFRYNPLTNKLDLSSEAGGGGSDITVSADSGVPIVGKVFSYKGQKALTTPVMSIRTLSNQVIVQNQAWLTQYVVDNSTTNGLKGTYATLQAAVNQALADGNAAYPLTANIMMRPGDYDLSTLVIPDGGQFHIYGQQPSLENAASGVRFNGIGTLDIDCASNILWENVQFADIPTFGVNCGNMVFDNVSLGGFVQNCSSLLFKECLVIGSDITINDTAGSFQSYDSYIYANITFNLTTNTGFNFYGHNSSFSNFFGTNLGNFRLFNSKYETLSAACSSGVDSNNFLINCSNVTINGINPTPCITGTGDFYVSNLSGYCYNGNPNIKNVAATQGNVIKSISVSGDYVATIYDYYIGVNDTSLARTITLPDPSDLLVRLSRNQSFIVKDESGAAGTNNITINTAGGLIDGAASASLSNNYAALTFKSDGTNYYII